jgi:hypothetical protein
VPEVAYCVYSQLDRTHSVEPIQKRLSCGHLNPQIAIVLVSGRAATGSACAWLGHMVEKSKAQSVCENIYSSRLKSGIVVKL